MATLALDSSGDLAIEGGRLVLVTDLSERAAIKLRQRLNIFLGEWFLDTRIGVPYYQLVLVKNPDFGVIRQLLRQVIEETPGVADVTELDVTYNASARTCMFAFRATTDAGDVIVGGSGAPFIVERTVPS